MARVLELGAGESPSPEATETLDIRDDLDHIDYEGVDIGEDHWPIEDGSIDRIIADHVLEHVPRDRILYVFEETNRVLVDGGRFEVTVPHAGTWEAHTDPSHHGSGGWTPDVEEYFADGSLEGYCTHLPWTVSAEARLGFPVLIRPSLRLTWRFRNGAVSNELVKLPFVSGVVEFHAVKNE